MAHHSKIWPAGLVNGVSPLDHTELEALDLQVFGSIDGDNGGVWVPITPVIVAGAGMRPTLENSQWPNFAAEAGGIRTFPRAISPTPVAFSSLPAITNPSFVPGDGLGGAFWREITHCLPDGAIITSIQLRVKIVAGHASLPTLFPRLSVYRFDVTAGTSVLLNSGDFGNGEACAIASGGTVGTYNLLGHASAIYTPNVNATVAKGQYTYFVTAIDEGGGGHLAGNQFEGFVVTYTAADARPA